MSHQFERFSRPPQNTPVDPQMRSYNANGQLFQLYSPAENLPVFPPTISHVDPTTSPDLSTSTHQQQPQHDDDGLPVLRTHHRAVKPLSLREGLTRKPRLPIRNTIDICILKFILSYRPYAAHKSKVTKVWDTIRQAVATHCEEKDQDAITVKSMKYRYKRLMKNYRNHDVLPDVLIRPGGVQGGSDQNQQKTKKDVSIISSSYEMMSVDVRELCKRIEEDKIHCAAIFTEQKERKKNQQQQQQHQGGDQDRVASTVPSTDYGDGSGENDEGEKVDQLIPLRYSMSDGNVQSLQKSNARIRAASSSMVNLTERGGMFFNPDEDIINDTHDSSFVRLPTAAYTSESPHNTNLTAYTAVTSSSSQAPPPPPPHGPLTLIEMNPNKEFLQLQKDLLMTQKRHNELLEEDLKWRWEFLAVLKEKNNNVDAEEMLMMNIGKGL